MMREKILAASTILAGSAAVGLTVAASFVAWKVGYQQAFGDPAFTYSGIQVHWPWRFIEWWLHWRGNIGPELERGRNIALAFLGGGGFVVWKAVLGGGKQAFGHDKWGTRKDADRQRLLEQPPAGTVLGAWPGGLRVSPSTGKWGKQQGKVISYDGPEHRLVIGAARSGKTVGPVISTLLTCTHSVLVYDPKRELHAATAKWRAALGPTPFVDFDNPLSARWNPLDAIRDEREIADAQSIAGILIEGANLTSEQNKFWAIAAGDLITSAILFVRHEKPDQCCLGHVYRLLSAGKPTWQAMAASRHPMVQPRGAAMADSDSETTTKNIQITALAALSVFSEPLVAALTSVSEFQLSDLMCGDKPMSLYLNASQSDPQRLAPIYRILITQATQQFLDSPDYVRGRPKKHRLLGIYDEFARLGRMPALLSQLSFGAGMGFTAMIVLQTHEQIIAAYTKDAQEIFGNCPIYVTFAPSDDNSASRISRRLGTALESKESVSKRDFQSGVSRTVSKIERPLMNEGEIRAMDAHKQFVLITNCKPMITDKLRWYDHPLFASRGTNTVAGEVPPKQHPDYGVAPIDVACFSECVSSDATEGKSAEPEKRGKRGRPRKSEAVLVLTN